MRETLEMTGAGARGWNEEATREAGPRRWGGGRMGGGEGASPEKGSLGVWHDNWRRMETSGIGEKGSLEGGS